MKDIQILNKSIGENLVNKVLLSNRELDVFKTASFINSLLSCLNSDKYNEITYLQPIVLAFDCKKNGTKSILIPSKFVEFVENGSLYNIITFVDAKGRFIKTENEVIENIIDFTHYSSNIESIVFFVVGRELTIGFKGKLIDYIANTLTGARAVSIKKGKTSIINYRKLVDKHFHEDIKTGKFIYWENRQDYILINKPEQHFQRHFYNFLKENVIESVSEEVQIEGTTDKVDIGVTTQSGNCYFFEVKWVGKSNGTDFDGDIAEQKLNEGIYQLNEYLINSKNALKGALIVYDARKEKNKIDIFPEFKLSRKLDKNPLMIELNPTSSSKKAKNEVANILRARKKNATNR